MNKTTRRPFARTNLGRWLGRRGLHCGVEGQAARTNQDGVQPCTHRPNMSADVTCSILVAVPRGTWRAVVAYGGDAAKQRMQTRELIVSVYSSVPGLVDRRVQSRRTVHTSRDHGNGATQQSFAYSVLSAPVDAPTRDGARGAASGEVNEPALAPLAAGAVRVYGPSVSAGIAFAPCRDAEGFVCDEDSPAGLHRIDAGMRDARTSNVYKSEGERA